MVFPPQDPLKIESVPDDKDQTEQFHRIPTSYLHDLHLYQEQPHKHHLNRNCNRINPKTGKNVENDTRFLV